jgi:hypothetical protein
MVQQQQAGKRPIDAILGMKEMLDSRGIDLIVMPIPNKAAVYPDVVTDAAPADRLVSVGMFAFMEDLLERDVEVINLYPVFAAWRKTHGDNELLYHRYDTHWQSKASEIAARLIADRLQRYGFAQRWRERPQPYIRKTVTVPGRTDIAPRDVKTSIADMPELAEDVSSILQPNGAAYEDDPRSPVIITADSFGRIYDGTSATTSAQLAWHLRGGIDRLHAMGSGPRIAKLLYEKGPNYLTGRRVFIWTSVARSFVKASWVDIPWPSEWMGGDE